MRPATILFLLFCCLGTVAAQSSKMSSTETTTEEGYLFKVKVSKNRLPELMKAYNQLTNQPENRRFSGVATQEKEGIIISLDTRKQQLYIETEATDGPGLTAAKAKADVVRKYLGAAAPPPPPAPPVPHGRG